ncbi:MAG: YrhA family protein [Alphaproteobacteria bacterium]|nr:YrhA family protein [Alphaproteobacteria bacterium]
MNNYILQSLNRIKEPDSILTSSDFITLQQTLKQKKYALLPSDFIDFLHLYNGLSYNGLTICGIYPQDTYQNILTLNQKNKHPLHKDIVFLGYNETDFLIYNQKHNVYQMIDKADLQVLEEYTTFSNTLEYILKIEDE